jgi:hypothetical protein
VSALTRADTTSFSEADTVAIDTPAAEATSAIRTLPGIGNTPAETFQHIVQECGLRYLNGQVPG